MKYNILFVSVSIILSGCASNPFTAENSKGDVYSSVLSNTTTESTSYLQIAKDLFVAGQYKQAYQISSNLAEKNDVEAQYLLGYMIYYGYGVPADAEQGTKWITVSADTGHRPAIEALVLIKHGLTPDNKCSSVNFVPDTEVASQSEHESKPIKKSNSKSKTKQKDNQVSQSDELKKSNQISSIDLKEGEILITPKKKLAVKNKTIGYVESDKVWNRYTIQLMIDESQSTALNFKNDFMKKYPDLSNKVISYKSINKPYSYGVGFSTFKKNDDALIVRDNIKDRTNKSSLRIIRLDNFEPIGTD